MNSFQFKDRAHAGILLAEALRHHAEKKGVIVLALPRGGVPVAHEVARRLRLPLDVIIVRKLGVPGWEEFAMGAIASGGVRVLDRRVIRINDISGKDIEAAVEKETQELHRREIAYRGHAGPPRVMSKDVIVVDDGMATGSTISAAVQALRNLGAQHITVAVPTAAPSACQRLRPLVDELVTLMVPDDFCAVGQWYEDFSQTTDEEIAHLLHGRALEAVVPCPP